MRLHLVHSQSVHHPFVLDRTIEIPCHETLPHLVLYLWKYFHFLVENRRREKKNYGKWNNIEILKWEFASKWLACVIDFFLLFSVGIFLHAQKKFWMGTWEKEKSPRSREHKKLNFCGDSKPQSELRLLISTISYGIMLELLGGCASLMSQLDNFLFWDNIS